jgi:hypothetical protein
MLTFRPFAFLLLSPLLAGCVFSHPLRVPDPSALRQQSEAEEHLEVHLMHHRMALEAHEAAVRLNELGAPTPAPPAP